MITDVEYMQLVTEEYDLSDYATKKKVLFCNEASKAVNVEHIVTRLYEHIKNNSTGIDFGTIPKSKGIITSVENYDKMIDCLNSIEELVKAYKDPSNTVREIYTAIDNIHNRERQFTKAFALNIEFPIMIYNMTVLSIVSSISLLISSSIEFIKNGHDSFTASFDKAGYNKSKDHVMFEYVTQFNRNCVNGTIDKAINECIKNNITSTNESTEFIDEGFKDVMKGALDIGATIGNAAIVKNLAKSGDKNYVSQAGDLTKKGLEFIAKHKTLKVVGIIISVGITLVLLIKLIVKLIAWWLRMSMKISDWFEIQANFLQINAENLKYRDDDKGDDHRKEVYQRQMKWVDRFKKISNLFAIKDSKARNDADKDDRRRTYDDDDDDSSNDDDDGLF